MVSPARMAESTSAVAAAVTDAVSAVDHCRIRAMPPMRWGRMAATSSGPTNPEPEKIRPNPIAVATLTRPSAPARVNASWALVRRSRDASAAFAGFESWVRCVIGFDSTG